MRYFPGMCFLNSASTYPMIWSYENRMFRSLAMLKVQCHIRHVALSLAGLWRSVLKELSPSFLSILHVSKCQTLLLREEGYVLMDVPQKLLHCRCHVFFWLQHMCLQQTCLVLFSNLHSRFFSTKRFHFLLCMQCMPRGVFPLSK